MKKPIYRLIPEYGGIIVFFLVILILGGFILWSISFFYALAFIILIVGVFYFFFKKIATLCLYDDFIVLKTCFGGKEEKFNYDKVDFIEYRFGGAKGNSSFTVYFENPILHLKGVTYGGESLPQVKRIIAFFKAKGVRVEIIPQEQAFKIAE